MWGHLVSVTPPRRDESCEVSVVMVLWDAVITIPGIQNSLLCVWGNQPGLVKWRHGVICLTRSMGVEHLEDFLGHMTIPIETVGPFLI